MQCRVTRRHVPSHLLYVGIFAAVAPEQSNACGRPAYINEVRCIESTPTSTVTLSHSTARHLSQCLTAVSRLMLFTVDGFHNAAWGFNQRQLRRRAALRPGTLCLCHLAQIADHGTYRSDADMAGSGCAAILIQSGHSTVNTTGTLTLSLTVLPSCNCRCDVTRDRWSNSRPFHAFRARFWH